jgi:hypothetical protein
MILVKSLIVIFLMLFLAKYYKRIMTFLSRILLDERESFADINTTNMFELEEEEDIMEEISYTVPSPLKKQAELNMESKMIIDLQEQMNELFRLSDKATEINTNLMKEI